MKVYVVTVFESGDFTTSVWGVFKHKEDAENYKEEKEVAISVVRKQQRVLEGTIGKEKYKRNIAKWLLETENR